MFSQLSSYLFSIVILLIFIFPSVYSTTCGYYERTCSKFSYTWCCSNYEYCGSFNDDCLSYTTPRPSVDIPSGVIALIVFVIFFIFLTCLSCCLRSRQQERLRASMINRNSSMGTYPYQQQHIHGSQRVVHNRSVYNVGGVAQIHSVYEDQPPSYEAATANLSPKSSSTSPPVIAMTEQFNSRI